MKPKVKQDKSASAVKQGQISLFVGIFACMKSAIGLGLLFLPRSASWKLEMSVGILLGFGTLCAISLYLLSRVMQRIHRYSYFAIGEQTYGPGAKWLSAILLIINLVCVCMVFGGMLCKYLGENILPFISNNKISAPKGFEIRHSGLVTLSVCLILSGICSIKNTQLMSKIAAFGFLGIIYTLAVLIINNFYGKETTLSGEAIKEPALFSQIVGLTLTACFAYANSFTYLDVIKSLENPTAQRQYTIIGVSAIGEMIIYVLFTIFGVRVFKPAFRLQEYEDCKDVLNLGAFFYSMEKNKLLNVLYNLGSIIYFFVCLVTYPLIFGPLKEVVVETMLPKTLSNKKKVLFDYVFSFTFCFVATILPVAIGLQNLDQMISACSAVAGSFLFFILPALFFLKTETPFKTKNVLDIVLMMTAFFTGLLSLLGFGAQFFLN